MRNGNAVRKLRVGVVGCGLIAQVMHVPHLRELDDCYEVVANCDLSPGTLQAVGDFFGIARRHSRWQDLMAEDLDAVMIFTAGSHHAPPAIAAAEAGRHVLVEKPMCFTLRQADAMIAAANRSRVVLMVANNKRYDPAYEYAKPLVTAIRDLRLVRITTLEAPLLPYVQHHRLIRPADVPADTLAALRAEHETLVREAIGDTAPDDVHALYADVLLDSLVHEVNAVRGLLGDPLEVTSAENWMGSEGVTTVLRFPGDVRCVMTWVNLPTLRSYSQELAFYGPSDRLALRFPSPFLRNEPTVLVLEGMEDGATWEKTLTVSYQESFKRELEHFYDCVVDGKVPYTTGQEARQDIVVLQAIARAAMARAPQALPSGRS